MQSSSLGGPRYLRSSDVQSAMPPLPERLELAARTLRALGAEAQLPPKIGVQPREPGSLAQAMPALLPGAAGDGSADLLGAKWIVGFPANPDRGLPAYHSLVVLNDGATGRPIGILDGGPITAARTAAVSGVALRMFAAGDAAFRRRPRPRVALLGAGAQAAAHLPVIAHVLAGASLTIHDRVPDRAAALVAAAHETRGIADAGAAVTVSDAVADADVVLSLVSFGPHRQALDRASLRADAVFVAVDYDMQAPAALADDAFFVVDERAQFLATRSTTVFAGYPDPDATLGEILRGAPTRPASGPVLVAHLGTGLADVVFGAVILERAERLGLGILLPS